MEVGANCAKGQRGMPSKAGVGIERAENGMDYGKA